MKQQLKQIAEIQNKVRTELSALDWDADCRSYVSAQAIQDSANVLLLQAEGYGVNCTTVEELLLAEQCGFTGQTILFSPDSATAEGFACANRLQAIIHVHEAAQLNFLVENAAVPQTLCFSPGGSTKEQLAQEMFRAHWMGANVFGLHARLSESGEASGFAQELLETANGIRSEVGLFIGFVCLSWTYYV